MVPQPSEAQGATNVSNDLRGLTPRLATTAYSVATIATSMILNAKGQSHDPILPLPPDCRAAPRRLQ